MQNNWDFYALPVVVGNGTDTLKRVWQHFIKINPYLPYGPVITHLFIYPKKRKSNLQTKTRTCVFT